MAVDTGRRNALAAHDRVERLGQVPPVPSLSKAFCCRGHPFCGAFVCTRTDVANKMHVRGCREHLRQVFDNMFLGPSRQAARATSAERCGLSVIPILILLKSIERAHLYAQHVGRRLLMQRLVPQFWL